MKRLIYLLLAALGFSCADSHDEWRDVVAEYGCPHVEFRVRARVVDEANNPIKGIKVSTDNGDYFYNNSGYSDEQGYIDATGSFRPGTEQSNLHFIDIDGEANGGEFETLTLPIEGVTQTQEDSGSWYEGAYTADMGTVTMKLKAQGDDEESPNEE